MRQTVPLDYRVMSTDPSDDVDDCHHEGECPHHHQRRRRRRR